jgi:hypothetical protein
MALVEKPIYTVSFTFVDETGSKANMEFYAPIATAIATVRSEADTLGTAIAALTGCALVGRSISVGAADTTVFGGGAGSRVENKGLFQFATAVPSYSRVQLPSIRPAFLTPEGRIQEDATEVAAFTAAVIAGAWSDNRGAAITALAKAYQRFRSTTRSWLPSKREPDIDTDPAT